MLKFHQTPRVAIHDFALTSTPPVRAERKGLKTQKDRQPSPSQHQIPINQTCSPGSALNSHVAYPSTSNIQQQKPGLTVKMPSMWLSDMQSTFITSLRSNKSLTRRKEIGVAFCSGGGFFLLGGVLLFFDRAMLAMGNILFLIGLTLIIGLQKTFAFFARRQKLRGTAAFAAGIALILLRWAFVGFVVELYGIFVLFGDFFATIAGFLYGIPYVGPYIAMALQRVSPTPRNESLPV